MRNLNSKKRSNQYDETYVLDFEPRVFVDLPEEIVQPLWEISLL